MRKVCERCEGQVAEKWVNDVKVCKDCFLELAEIGSKVVTFQNNGD